MELVLVLAVLVVDVVLFAHGRLRMDLVALLTLVFLAVTGLIEPAEALAGFSNPAVVTVWAVFVLSEGLAHTGIANMFGRGGPTRDPDLLALLKRGPRAFLARGANDCMCARVPAHRCSKSLPLSYSGHDSLRLVDRRHAAMKRVPG